MRIPTPGDVADVLAACEPNARAGVYLAAFAGLRAGEVCGLHVVDVDFLRRAVHVRRQVQVRAGVPVEVAPKSRASERTVPVASTVLDRVAGLGGAPGDVRRAASGRAAAHAADAL